MKIVNLILGWLAGTLYALTCQAQGTFQNLDFEEASPVVISGNPYYPYAVTPASALPYWTVSYGNSQPPYILENAYSLGATQVTLLGPGHESDSDPIDGNYSVLLQGGTSASAASISQTGVIPAGTQSLLFEAQPPAFSPAPGPLEVFIGAQAVPYSAVGGGPNYTLYGANLSAWAGQTEQLTFSAPEDFSILNNWIIDDISFSPATVIPEQDPLALMGVGAALFAVYRRVMENRKQRAEIGWAEQNHFPARHPHQRISD